MKVVLRDRDGQSETTLKRLQAIIKDSIEHGWEYLIDNMPWVEISSNDVESLECYSRDGFIPHSHNSGGYEKIGFAYQSDSLPNFPELNKAIEKASDYNIEYAREEFERLHPDVVKELKASNLEIDYHDLETIGHSDLALELEEMMRDDEESYMFKLQIMYQGLDEENNHILYISMQINWEYPYFRDYMPMWAGSGKMHAAVEREFKTKTVNCKRKFIKELESVISQFLEGKE